MTYARFHLWFNLPPLSILLIFQPDWSRFELWLLAGLLLIIMAFTSPWDNYAAKLGIWAFPENKHFFKIRYLPIEEYAFFWLQSLNVILSLRILLPGRRCFLETTTPSFPLLAGVLFLWGLAAILLQWKPPMTRWNYVRHLFFWFIPVILLQWILAPRPFIHHQTLLGGLFLGWGLYYTAADLVATRAGIWTFDEQQITGIKLAGILPWEECAFFLLTSLLVAQSWILLLPAALR